MNEKTGESGIDELVRATRERREAVHELIVRMRSDQAVWLRDLSRLVRQARLTPLQRQRLRPAGGTRPR